MEESYTACVDPLLWGSGPVAASGDLDGFLALQINTGTDAQAQPPNNQAQAAAKSHSLGPETLCRTSVTRGRRICVAVGDDCCTQKVLKYASKYILKSKDTVTLVHVCCKGHKSAGSSGGSQGGQQQAHQQQQGQQLQQQQEAQLAASPERSAGAAAAAAAGVGANGAAGEVGAAAGVAPGADWKIPSSGTQAACESAGGGTHAGSSGGGNSGSGSGGSKPGGPMAAAHQLLERAKAALLQSGKVRPEQVSAVVLPPAKHVGQALVAHCLHNHYDILVIGSRGSGSSMKAKLRSLMGGSCPSVSKYCAQHLHQPLAVVVVAPPEGHDWGPKCR